jgi:hypothetical protein
VVFNKTKTPDLQKFAKEVLDHSMAHSLSRGHSFEDLEFSLLVPDKIPVPTIDPGGMHASRAPPCFS